MLTSALSIVKSSGPMGGTMCLHTEVPAFFETNVLTSVTARSCGDLADFLKRWTELP